MVEALPYEPCNRDEAQEKYRNLSPLTGKYGFHSSGLKIPESGPGGWVRFPNSGSRFLSFLIVLPQIHSGVELGDLIRVAIEH